VAKTRYPIWNTVVLGAGPVGLAAALAAARGGHTLVLSPNIADPADPPRIDVVPGPFLALLLELGVVPRQIGVDELHDRRWVAWDSERPELVRGRAMAHIERPALELALMDAVRRRPEIHVAVGSAADLPRSAGIVIDATGRRAYSAERRVRPPEEWIAKTFWSVGNFPHATQAFRIAALPGGYAYRVGTKTRILVGLVVSKSVAVLRPDQIETYIQSAQAGWLLADLPDLSSMSSARGGAASVQWGDGWGPMVPVGDAALARDSLASQGLSSGISDAVSFVRRERRCQKWAERHEEQRHRHLSALHSALSRSRFARSPELDEYARFLSRYAQRNVGSAPAGVRAPAVLTASQASGVGEAMA
jgi:2-polyprenyl-6-methoxyphenol hydroxylase-like FAD-dependent oxidoreductase